MEHIAVDDVDLLQLRERDTPTGADKVRLGRARVRVHECDNDQVRKMHEGNVDFQGFPRRVQLGFDAV